MIIVSFFGIVVAFSLLLNVIDKIRSYNKPEDHSVWQDADGVVVKPKNSPGMVGAFGIHLDKYQENQKEDKAS